MTPFPLNRLKAVCPLLVAALATAQYSPTLIKGTADRYNALTNYSTGFLRRVDLRRPGAEGDIEFFGTFHPTVDLSNRRFYRQHDLESLQRFMHHCHLCVLL